MSDSTKTSDYLLLGAIAAVCFSFGASVSYLITKKKLSQSPKKAWEKGTDLENIDECDDEFDDDFEVEDDDDDYEEVSERYKMVKSF